MYCIQVSALRKPDMEEQMMKLQPVLEKLRSLDPKTFGLLNNMMDQAQATSFLQMQDPTMDQEDRLARRRGGAPRRRQEYLWADSLCTWSEDALPHPVRHTYFGPARP